MVSVKLCLVVVVLLYVSSLSAKRTAKRLPGPMTRESQKECRADEEFAICPSNLVSCRDASKCIYHKWVCDTAKDCDDGSDEVNCPTDCSHPNQFKCRGGFCISRDFVCDGENDCGDSSDEYQCQNFVCSEGEIHCDNYICIESSWRCDGENDCGTNWDEQGCIG